MWMECPLTTCELNASLNSGGGIKSRSLEAALADLVNSSLLKRVSGRVRLPAAEPVVTAKKLGTGS